MSATATETMSVSEQSKMFELLCEIQWHTFIDWLYVHKVIDVAVLDDKLSCALSCDKDCCFSMYLLVSVCCIFILR